MQCYICGESFETSGEVHRVGFLYKPWKNFWRHNEVCDPCYQLIKTVNGYPWPWRDYAYPGILKEEVYRVACWRDNQWVLDTDISDEGYYEEIFPSIEQQYSWQNRYEPPPLDKK